MVVVPPYRTSRSPGAARFDVGMALQDARDVLGAVDEHLPPKQQAKVRRIVDEIREVANELDDGPRAEHGAA